MSNHNDQARRGHWKKDAADRGVYLRGKVWYVRFADQSGRMHAEAVGPSKAVALKVYQKRQAEVAERRFFPATGVSFAEIVDDAIALARESFTRKHPNKKFKPGNYGIVREWFPGRAADSITPSEIAARITSHTQVPATFNRFRVAISHVFRIALDNTKVPANPGSWVKMHTEDNERVRYLNQHQEDEEARLRDAVRQLVPEKEAEIDLALHTGMRWEEQYSLRWENVDLIRGVIKIVQPKGGKAQHIAINSAARGALQRLKSLSSGPLVCPAANGEARQVYNDRPNYDQHRGWWLAVLEAAGLEDFHWHDLRHTFASRLVMRGVDIFTVCRLMRHQDIKVTMRYAHLADKHLASAVDKLVEGVTASVTGSEASPKRPPYLQ